MKQYVKSAAFSVSQSSGQSIPPVPDVNSLVTHTRLVFNMVSLNTKSGYTNTTGIFKAPEPGTYSFSTSLQMASLAQGTAVALSLVKNGGAEVRVVKKTVSGDDSISLSSVFELVAGDTVEVKVAHQSQGAMSTKGGFGTYFCGFKNQAIGTQGPPGPSGGYILGEIRTFGFTGPLENGWLDCDGSTYAIADYSELSSKLAGAWNLGDEPAGYFRVPDLRGRSPLGLGDSPSLTSRTMAELGGSETHMLSVSELPSHSHPGSTSEASSTDLDVFSGSGSNGISSALGLTAIASVSVGIPSISLTVASEGDGEAHNNMHPFAGVRFVIRAKT